MVKCGSGGYSVIAIDCMVIAVMDHDYSLASIEVPTKRKRPYSDTRRLLNGGIKPG